MPTRQPRSHTTTPTQRRSSSMCVYCKRHERRVGYSTCSEACSERRRQVNAAYRERIAVAQGRTITHYRKRSAQDGEPVKRQRKRLSDAELLAHHQANTKRHNDRCHELTKQAAQTPHCERCGDTLLRCECPPVDAHVPQYRDVVVTLNVATMKRKVEVR